jgi:hypothetical protein
MKKTISIGLFLLMAVLAMAQNNGVNDPAPTGLRADGKIWVVMAVCITILAGLFAYVIRLDRKISRLEKKG